MVPDLGGVTKRISVSSAWKCFQQAFSNGKVDINSLNSLVKSPCKFLGTGECSLTSAIVGVENIKA